MKSIVFAALAAISTLALAAPKLECEIEYNTNNEGLESATVAGKAVPLKVSTGKMPEATTEASAGDDAFGLKAKYTSNVWFGPADGPTKPTGEDKIEIQLELKEKRWTMHLGQEHLKPGFNRWGTAIIGDFGRHETRDGKRFTAKRVFLTCTAAG